MRQFFDAVTPALELLVTCRRTCQCCDYLDDLNTVRNRNREVERQNIELRLRVEELTRAELLMNQYRNLLNLPEEPGFEMVNARVIADLNSPFVHTLVARADAIVALLRGRRLWGLTAWSGGLFPVAVIHRAFYCSPILTAIFRWWRCHLMCKRFCPAPIATAGIAVLAASGRAERWRSVGDVWARRANSRRLAGRFGRRDDQGELTDWCSMICRASLFALSWHSRRKTRQ